MTDAELLDHFRYLGIDRSNHRVVALLPLAQVAWADGRVQAAERKLIVATAARLGLPAGGSWQAVLDDWLRMEPTPLQYLRGQEVLLALAQRTDPEFALDKSTLDELVDLSMDVAKAAGGLFGLAFQVTAEERRAVADIAQILSLGPTVDWASLQPHEGPSWSP